MSDEIDNETGNEIKLDVIPSPPKKKGGRRKRAVSEKEQERWNSPEWHEHLKKIGRQKGDPKVPGSGRRATPKETKEWIAGKSIDVAEFMWDLMNDDTQPIKERRAAAVWLGEMSMAKAPTESKVEVNHTHDIPAMLLEAQRMATSKLIDVTPKPKVIEDDSDA
ncbi:hypothetical protein CDO26_27905 (plasmid) [Sinorhizobium meliloti]|uniref:hypothetical protein n=1 Tax=Rhizobium meliloti TaxID=382 RepID=UPI000B4A2306|nr:hypothetical protein [Sinorhizobium meliloti]ASP88176.1 hypothetical protein CDO26_27905 [Sinorhizobium meliloti]MQW30005.1 hypothetical protein [Sinorhizobium meliloti]